jgi:hypothetical protein
MHKGIRHSRKNKSYRGLKNKSYRGLKNKSYRGGMGATEYVSGMYGDLTQQMASATQHMQLSPLSHAASAAQSGGKRNKSFRRLPRETSSRLAGGSGISHELKPADYGGEMGAMSDGQKGGYMMQLLERAAVPFGLMALRGYAGKYSRKNRKSKK